MIQSDVLIVYTHIYMDRTHGFDREKISINSNMHYMQQYFFKKNGEHIDESFFFSKKLKTCQIIESNSYIRIQINTLHVTALTFTKKNI